MSNDIHNNNSECKEITQRIVALDFDSTLGDFVLLSTWYNNAEQPIIYCIMKYILKKLPNILRPYVRLFFKQLEKMKEHDIIDKVVIYTANGNMSYVMSVVGIIEELSDTCGLIGGYYFSSMTDGKVKNLKMISNDYSKIFLVDDNYTVPQEQLQQLIKVDSYFSSYKTSEVIDKIYEKYSFACKYSKEVFATVIKKDEEQFNKLNMTEDDELLRILDLIESRFDKNGKVVTEELFKSEYFVLCEE